MEVPTNNLIKIQKINFEAEKLQNRMMEIIGERTTLQTKLQYGEIDSVLCFMKLQCLDYEMKIIIEPKINIIANELEFVEMLMDSKIELSEN